MELDLNLSPPDNTHQTNDLDPFNLAQYTSPKSHQIQDVNEDIQMQHTNKDHEDSFEFLTHQYKFGDTGINQHNEDYQMALAEPSTSSSLGFSMDFDRMQMSQMEMDQMGTDPCAGGEIRIGRKKRAQVRIACTHCQKACKKCSNTR